MNYDEWLRQYLLQMPQGMLAAQPVPQPGPQGLNLPTPNVSVEGTMNPKENPRINMGVNLPTYGGELGISGGYRRGVNDPSEFEARLAYRRRF